MEPHPEWITPHASAADYYQPYAAGVPGEFRVFYFPKTGSIKQKVMGLESGLSYRACWWNPAAGKESPAGTVRGPAEWTPPPPLIFQDYVLVPEKV